VTSKIRIPNCAQDGALTWVAGGARDHSHCSLEKKKSLVCCILLLTKLNERQACLIKLMEDIKLIEWFKKMVTDYSERVVNFKEVLLIQFLTFFRLLVPIVVLFPILQPPKLCQ
jgi:hypothetical protein